LRAIFYKVDTSLVPSNLQISYFLGGVDWQMVNDLVNLKDPDELLTFN
tara:strand:- start:4536 stop:4679 length:144 start_codon:yes stop_codon:yes gene_type:complete